MRVMAISGALVLAVVSSFWAGDAPQGLVGSWRLVSYEDRPAAGPPVFPYGAPPNNRLQGTAGGLGVRPPRLNRGVRRLVSRLARRVDGLRALEGCWQV